MGEGEEGRTRAGRRWWWRAATVVFLAAALGFAAALLFGQWQELRRLRAEVGSFGWRISAGWLLAAVALGTADLAWMGGAWVHLYRAGGGTLGYGRGVRVWIATNLGRYIPGKVWQLSGLALHLRRTGGSGALGLTSALVFQVVTLLTGTAVAAATLGGGLARVPSASPEMIALIVLSLMILLHPRIVRAAIRAAARVTREDVGELQVPRPRDLAVAGGLLTAAWGIYGLGFWCLLKGLTPAPAAGPVTLTGVFAAAYVAGYLVLVAPGGLVVREGAMTALLAALTPLGAAVGGAVAVAARIWVTATELVAFGLAATLPGGRAGGPDAGTGEGGGGAAS